MKLEIQNLQKFIRLSVYTFLASLNIVLLHNLTSNRQHREPHEQKANIQSENYRLNLWQIELTSDAHHHRSQCFE